MANWKNSPIAGIVLALVIVIALAFVVKNAMPKKYSYTADLKCELCDAVYQAKVFSGERPPYKCIECGKKAAYRALRCMDCGEIFIQKPVVYAEDMSEEERMKQEMEMMEPKCPECDSRNLGSVTPRVSVEK